MEGITLRELDTEYDFAFLAELLNKVRLQTTTAELLRESEEKVHAGQIRQTLVAQTAEKSFAGYCLVTHRPSAKAGRLYLDVAVDPAWRGQGLGTRLYDNALAFALAQGAVILDADVYDNCPLCLQFAEKRGFAIDRHLFESSLDLRTFDPRAFDGLVQAVEASGIRLFSLADAGDTEAIRRQLYDVNRRAALDDPASHGTFPSYEEFSGFVFTASWFQAEGQILAADGDEIIGLSAVGAFDGVMENMMTGVLPAYRRRKIAQALKVVALRYAKESGAARIRTHNDSQNAAMLAINRKLGYEAQVGEYRLTRRL